MKYFKAIFFVLLSLVLISSLTLAYYNTVEIVSISGDVKVLPKGKTTWIKADIGMVLRGGDRIKTGQDSRCDLAFDKKRKNTIGVLQDSDVIILLKGTEKIEIIDANLYVKLLTIPTGSKFEIKTPTAVCGARGTGLGVKANKESTEATAYKNNIYVKNEAGEEEGIKQGYKRNIDKYGKISKQIAAKAEDIEKYNSWSSDIDKIIKSEKRSMPARLEKTAEKTSEEVEKVDEKAVEAREEVSGAPYVKETGTD